MNKALTKIFLPALVLILGLASCGPSGGGGGSSVESSEVSSNPSIDTTIEYTVSFDLNYSGSPAGPASQTVYANAKVTKPADPSRDGYTFKYWAADLYGMDEWDFAVDIVMMNMTLYASWEFEVVVIPPKTFYVDIPEFWKVDGGLPAIHMWDSEELPNTTWPGNRMTLVSGDIYSYEVPGSYANFMFARVNPTDPIADWGAKTIELSFTDAGTNNLFTIDETVLWGDPGCSGTWSVYSA